MRAVVKRVVALALACAAASAAHAQDFYKGKQIQLIVGYEAGNDYDIGARLLARYLTRHIPGQPTIIVQNMPQAAGVVAANHLYIRAPRDGTVHRLDLAQFPEPGHHGAAQHRGRPAPLHLARRHLVSRPRLRRHLRRDGQDDRRPVHARS